MISSPQFALVRGIALAVAGFAFAPTDLAAQAVGQTFSRRDDCIASGKLSVAQCENAYRNARAEFEQKAPRYATRAACLRAHKACGAQVSTTGGWDSLARGTATYVPRFLGIRVSGEGDRARTLPVVEGGARIAFSPRQVAALDDRVGARRSVTGGARETNRAASGAPYVRRGDRDDTVRVPMQQKRIGADVAPGLYVDPDGVEWYKPATRR